MRTPSSKGDSENRAVEADVALPAWLQCVPRIEVEGMCVLGEREFDIRQCVLEQLPERECVELIRCAQPVGISNWRMKGAAQ